MWSLNLWSISFFALKFSISNFIVSKCGLPPTLGATTTIAGILSPLPSWCFCSRHCWPRMMWQCHVSSSECRCYRLKGFSLLKRLPLSAGGSWRLLEQPVGDWLDHIGLPQYESKLLLNGFDDLRYMVSNLLFLCIIQIKVSWCYVAVVA